MKKALSILLFFFAGALTFSTLKGVRLLFCSEGEHSEERRYSFNLSEESPRPSDVKGAGSMADKTDEMKTSLGDLLPKEICGWKAEKEDEFYDPETIFDYIDGAGEVYRSYNFRLLLARRFTKEGQPDIIVDLFDMGSSPDAYGVFSHDLEGEETGIGQGSTYKGGLLSFWKDRFFVSVYTEEETEEAKRALYALGQAVSASIAKEGKKPEVASLLPAERLAEKSVHYFHNHLILNYHFYVSEENILLLDQNTEAVLGTYKEKSEKYYLLLIRYPDAGKASVVFKSFTEAYMPDAKEPGLVQTEDLKWTAAKALGDFLFIVFDAPSKSLAREELGKIEKRIRQRK